MVGMMDRESRGCGSLRVAEAENARIVASGAGQGTFDWRDLSEEWRGDVVLLGVRFYGKTWLNYRYVREEGGKG